MGRSDTVSLTYTAEIADLKKKLREIPGVTAAEANRAVKAIDKATREIEKSQARVRSFTQSASVMAAGVLAAGAAIGKLAQDVANTRNGLTDLSTRTGVARSTIAGLKLAAEGSGLAFSDVESILNKLPKTLYDVARGSKDQADAFKVLGVEATNADGSIRDSDTVMRELLTAIGNDYGYEEVFARQVRAIGNAGDVLLAISTSGRSPNVLAALKQARERGLTTVALVGAASNPDLDACDLVIAVPDPSTARVQEMHLVILHLICDLVDKALASGS